MADFIVKFDIFYLFIYLHVYTVLRKGGWFHCYSLGMFYTNLNVSNMPSSFDNYCSYEIYTFWLKSLEFVDLHYRQNLG